MKDMLNKLLWALKMKNKLGSLSAQLRINDHPELTKFLKDNEQFRSMAKSFHKWKEGLKKEAESHLVEDKQHREVRKGPESKGFKKP
jgi:hypothetical protein